jgi:predicted dehydrogenase
MVRVGMVGLGKMGLSHYSMINAHPDVEVVAICDSSSYLLGVVSRYNGVKTYTDLSKMLKEAELDAVVISTPTSLHAGMVKTALEAGVDVFCEKPFSLDPADSKVLTDLAVRRGRVTQVGYHYRFVGSFKEVDRLLAAGALGTVSHALAEAYGPVVLKAKGSTWRSKKSQGGGALYDYAAHPLNLLNWYFGSPTIVAGTILGHVFSQETDDEVHSTFRWSNGVSAHLSVSWSDDSQRKMSTKITIWGTNGWLFADRQECQVYLRDASLAPDGYEAGWNVKYTPDLTDSVYFYVRGEEYSAQLASFVERIKSRETTGQNDFASASVTDDVLARMVADANALESAAPVQAAPPPPSGEKRRGLFGGRKSS